MQPMDGILLVVVFNLPNFSIIPLLEVLLRPVFSRIVYCGFNPSDNDTLRNMEIFRQKGIEILTYPEPEGVLAGGFSMGQICSVLAMNKVQEVQVMINTNR